MRRCFINFAPLWRAKHLFLLSRDYIMRGAVSRFICFDIDADEMKADRRWLREMLECVMGEKATYQFYAPY